MSLPSPPLMPSTGPKDQNFELERVDYLAPEAGGQIGGITAGFPLWKTTMTLGTLTIAQSDQWRGFVLGQRGAQRLFYGYEVSRRLPRAYTFGLPAGFSGAAASWSQTIDANGFAVLTLNGMPAGLALAPGDYVDFRWGTYSRAMVRVIEPGVASVSGSISCSVEPPLTSVVPTNAIAHLDNPACLMKLTSETKLGAITRRGAIDGGTIVAVQSLIP